MIFHSAHPVAKGSHRILKNHRKRPTIEGKWRREHSTSTYASLFANYYYLLVMGSGTRKSKTRMKSRLFWYPNLTRTREMYPNPSLCLYVPNIFKIASRMIWPMMISWFWTLENKSFSGWDQDVQRLKSNSATNLLKSTFKIFVPNNPNGQENYFSLSWER